MIHTVETLTQILNQYPKDTPVVIQMYPGSYLIEQTQATLQPVVESRYKYSDSSQDRDLKILQNDNTDQIPTYMVVLAEDD